MEASEKVDMEKLVACVERAARNPGAPLYVQWVIAREGEEYVQADGDLYVVGAGVPPGWRIVGRIAPEAGRPLGRAMRE